MSQTERLMDIWLYIVKNREFTAGELADKFGVSSRTITRDLDHLSVLGVPLYSVQGKGGGYKVLDSVQLPPVSFSEDELKSILFAYYMLESAGDNPFQIEISSVKEKLTRQMPEYIREKTNELTSHIDFMYPNRNVDNPSLRILYRASEKGEMIRAIYRSADGDEEIVFFPIGTYTWNGFWYAVGFIKLHSAYRIFRVDRFKSAVIDENSNIPDKVWTLAEWKNHGWDKQKKIRIQLRITKHALRSITNVWMQQGALEDKGNGEIILSFICPESQVSFVISDILKLGNGTVVLEPKAIREQIKTEILKMADLYT